MKLTEYSVEIVKKDEQTYTKFVIGKKCNKSRLVKFIISMGGEIIKNTAKSTTYEVKGNWMYTPLVL